MASTIKVVLLNSLEDLGKKDLRKFCARLLDREREGEPQVRRSALEDQDRIGVADVLVSTFTEAEAGRVAVELLRAIHCNSDAVRLEDKLDELKQPASQPSAKNTSPPSTAQPVVHFVDQHRAILTQRIKRFSGSPGILEKLLESSVLSQEQYEYIMAQNSPLEQAENLYETLMSSGIRGKDIFYSVLEELESFLIEDLK